MVSENVIGGCRDGVQAAFWKNWSKGEVVTAERAGR